MDCHYHPLIPYLRIVPLVALERAQQSARRLHLHTRLRLQLLALALLRLPFALLLATIVFLLAQLFAQLLLLQLLQPPLVLLQLALMLLLRTLIVLLLQLLVDLGLVQPQLGGVLVLCGHQRFGLLGTGQPEAVRRQPEHGQLGVDDAGGRSAVRVVRFARRRRVAAVDEFVILFGRRRTSAATVVMTGGRLSRSGRH